MQKMAIICMGLFFLAASLVLMSCPNEKEDTPAKSAEAKLLSFRIGDMLASRVPTAISGADYDDENLDLHDFFDEKYFVEMSFNSADDFTNKPVVIRVSDGAKAAYSTPVESFTRPGNFGTGATASFAPGNFIFVRVTAEDGKTVNYYIFCVQLEYDYQDLHPYVLQMNGGTKVTKAEWPARRAEIRTIMQDNCYGQWRSGEAVDYSISGNTLTVKVSHDGKNVEFNAAVQLPTTDSPPTGGWPVILAFGALDGADGIMGSKGNPRQHALDKGYANISVPTGTVAADGNARTGAFYTLYPYTASAASQTGVLLAWAWGASKVLDALEAGAAAEFNINANNTIITGTSRNGKAAAVAGAFEERIKITVPVSSGAGGCAIYRYKTTEIGGQTYDLSGYFGYNGGGAWRTYDNSPTDNPEKLNNVRGGNQAGWFNAKFQTFAQPEDLPFDQHFLLALCAGTNRHLFMINGFEWDKWTNPPGFFYAFELTKSVFSLLGIPQNIAVSMHRFRHGIEQEDMVKLINYANYAFYGAKNLDFDYAETGKPKPATWEAFMADLHITPFSASVSPANNATYEAAKPE